MANTSLRIKKFDPTKMRSNCIIFLIGKRNTGKSVLMRDLLYNMPRPDYVIAMAPTDDTIQMFREFLPETCIFDHFSQEKLESAVNLQREFVSRGKERRLMILLDDVLYQKNVLNSTAMRHIFFNGRHDNITLLCASQYLMQIAAEFRSNIDMLFALRDNVLLNRQKMWKNFFGQFSRFEEFDRVMSACTESYKCLVLDGTSSSSDYTDSVKWYRASTDVPAFKLCRPIYWNLAQKYGKTQAEVRREAVKQFEIETAAATAIHNSGGGAGGAKGAASRKTTIVVQTEDETGNVVDTFV